MSAAGRLSALDFRCAERTTETTLGPTYRVTAAEQRPPWPGSISISTVSTSQTPTPATNCLADGFGLDLKRTLTLQRNGQTVGQIRNSIADFAVPRQAADYRLTYDVDVDVDAGAALPVSTRITTAWTFRSPGPSGTGSSPLPLLSVDYALPLDTANHPSAAGTARFTIRQAIGVRPQAVTAVTFSLRWTTA